MKNGNNILRNWIWRKRVIILSHFLIFSFSHSLKAAGDTLVVKTDDVSTEHRFNAKQLVAPALLIGIGTWGLAEQSPIDWLEQRARDNMNPNWKKCKADEYLQYVPTGAHLVLGFVPGVKAKHNFRDRAIASLTANILMAGVTNTVKYTVKEQRPDSGKRNSFFSGHTATAFTGAELMRIEYGWGYGAAAYAVAATTAYLRVYNKRHWVGDVMAGAGTGILCANAGYWLLPVWKRCFGIDRRDQARKARKQNKPLVVASPFYLHEEKAAGFSCSLVLR